MGAMCASVSVAACASRSGTSERRLCLALADVVGPVRAKQADGAGRRWDVAGQGMRHHAPALDGLRPLLAIGLALLAHEALRRQCRRAPTASLTRLRPQRISIYTRTGDQNTLTRNLW